MDCTAERGGALAAILAGVCEYFFFYMSPYWQVCVNIFFSICRHIGRFVCVCVYTYLFIGGNASSGGTKFLLPNTDSHKSVYSGFMALCQY